MTRRGLGPWLALLPLLLAGCGAPPPPGVAAIPSRADPRCLVTRVVDGDTLEIACSESNRGNVRLLGFDTPETFRPGCAAERSLGQQARAYLEQRLRSARLIDAAPEGRDRYGRVLVRLRLDGQDLARIMIDAGLAVAYDGGRRINWCARLAQT